MMLPLSNSALIVFTHNQASQVNNIHFTANHHSATSGKFFIVLFLWCSYSPIDTRAHFSSRIVRTLQYPCAILIYLNTKSLLECSFLYIASFYCSLSILLIKATQTEPGTTRANNSRECILSLTKYTHQLGYLRSTYALPCVFQSVSRCWAPLILTPAQLTNVPQGGTKKTPH